MHLINALVLTGLATFRVVGNPSLTGLSKACASSAHNGRGALSIGLVSPSLESNSIEYPIPERHKDG
jgi:hypothetical protein